MLYLVESWLHEDFVEDKIVPSLSFPNVSSVPTLSEVEFQVYVTAWNYLVN